MDYHLTEEQQMLSNSLRRFIDSRYPLEDQLRLAESEPGFNRDTWREFAELGALGALFDPALGGYGGTASDIATVFEELGRGAVASPALTALLSGTLLAKAGVEATDQLILELQTGDAIVAFAHQCPTSRYALEHVDTAAIRTDDGWRISGAKTLVAFGSAADHFIVSARTSGAASDVQGISLFLIPATADGISVRGYVGIDGVRRAEISLDEVFVGSDQLLGAEGGAYTLIEAACAAAMIAICADAMGALEIVKDATAEYLRTRVQFGQPIGSFQALQHRMATLLIEIEQARSALTNAISDFDASPVQRDLSLSAAKYTFGRVGTLVAEEAVQMHGGIGMTWELPVSHYVKRLIALDHQLGDTDHHIERYIALSRPQ